MPPIIFENEALHLEFDPANGALTRLIAVETGWEIVSRPELGLAFRLLVPLSPQRNNPVYGEKQALSRTDRSDKGVTFTWDKVTSEHGGNHNIKVVLQVTLEKRNVRFQISIENRSEYTVENVYCPYFGDLRHPADEEWFKAFWYTY